MPKLFFIFLLLLGSFVCFAFQQPTNADSARLQAFEEQKKEALAKKKNMNPLSKLLGMALIKKVENPFAKSEKFLNQFCL